MLVNPGMVLISFKMISSGPRTKKSTLAIPAASIARNAATAAGTQAWVIDYSAEGEAVEASSDENWNQKASVELTVTPRALNPMPIFTN